MEDILELLYEERIFIVKINPDKKSLTFTEACDRHFEVDLSKKQLLRLIQQLEEINKIMH